MDALFIPLPRAAALLRQGYRKTYELALAGRFGPIQYEGSRLFVSSHGVSEYGRKAAAIPPSAGAA